MLVAKPNSLKANLWRCAKLVRAWNFLLFEFRYGLHSAVAPLLVLVRCSAVISINSVLVATILFSLDNEFKQLSLTKVLCSPIKSRSAIFFHIPPTATIGRLPHRRYLK